MSSRKKVPEIGDIILIDFDPQVGHEISKRRPALVVSRTFFNENTNFIWVCPISSTIKNYPTDILLDGNTKTQREIKVNQIRSLDYKNRGWIYLEKAPAEILLKVKHIIDAITNLND